MSAPFGKLEPLDIDGDGVFELKGVQRISGIYQADGVANAEMVLKFNGTVWQPQSVKLIINID